MTARTGWSVIVRGHLHPVMDEVEQARLDRLGSPSWTDVFRDRRWLRLDPVVVTGRLLGTPPQRNERPPGPVA